MLLETFIKLNKPKLDESIRELADYWLNPMSYVREFLHGGEYKMRIVGSSRFGSKGIIKHRDGNIIGTFTYNTEEKQMVLRGKNSRVTINKPTSQKVKMRLDKFIGENYSGINMKSIIKGVRKAVKRNPDKR